MTEKRFTRKEISIVMSDVFNKYIKLFQTGDMTFSEYAIIENLGMKLANKFDEYDND